MGRAETSYNLACITLSSATCAIVARRVEEELAFEDEPTVVIPTKLLTSLLAEAGRDGAETGAPRFEIVQLEPEDAPIEIDDAMFIDDEPMETERDAFDDAFAALTRG